jgi:hypothetical protein
MHQGQTQRGLGHVLLSQCIAAGTALFNFGFLSCGAYGLKAFPSASLTNPAIGVSTMHYALCIIDALTRTVAECTTAKGEISQWTKSCSRPG